MIQNDKDQRQDDQQSLPQAPKKPYARPELVKHGNVETLTKQSTGGGGPSDPNTHPIVF